MYDLIPPQFQTRFDLLATCFGQREHSTDELIISLETLSLAIEKFLEQFASCDAKILLNHVYREEYYQEFAAINHIMMRLASALNLLEQTAFSTMRSIDLQQQLLELVSTRMINSFKKLGPDSVNHALLKNLYRFIFSQRDYLEDFLKVNNYGPLLAAEEIRIRKDEATIFGQLSLLQQRKQVAFSDTNRLKVSLSDSDVDRIIPPIKPGTPIVKPASKMTKVVVEAPKSILDFILPKGTLMLPANTSFTLGRFGDGLIAKYREKFAVFIKTLPVGEVNIDATKTSALSTSIENELLILQNYGAYPTILTCYGCILETSFLQIIYQLPKFGSLDSLLQDDAVTTIPFPLIIGWLYDLADALQFLHTHGIIHRSVATDNCYLFSRLKLKLANFQASYSIYDVTTSSPTCVSAICDSPTNIVDISKRGDSMKACIFQSDIQDFWITAMEMLSRQPRQKVAQRVGREGIEELVQETMKRDSEQAGNGKNFYSPVWHSLKQLYRKRMMMTSMELRDELCHYLEIDLKGDPREKDNLTHHRKMRLFSEEFKQTVSFSQFSEYFDRTNHSYASTTSTSPRRIVNKMLKSAKDFRDSFRIPSPVADMEVSPRQSPSLETGKGMGKKSLSLSDLSSVSSSSSRKEREKILIDYRRDLINWLMNTVHLEAGQSEELAIVFLKHGLVTVDQLARKYEEDSTFLSRMEPILESSVIQRLIFAIL